MGQRWTIRGVQPEAIALVQEVSAASGQTLGELVTEAISVWYASLPDNDEDVEGADIVMMLQLVAEQIRLVGQLCQMLDGPRTSTG